MNRFLVAAVCVLALCGLLTVMLLPQPASSTSSFTSSAPSEEPPASASQSSSQSTPQTTPQTTPAPTTQTPPPQTVLPTTPQNTSPPSTSENPPQNTSQPTPAIEERPGNRTLQEAVGNATNYMAKSQEPYALLLLNVLYRRFGIPEFADSLQRYDQILATNTDNAPLLRIFRRIAAYQNSVEPTDFYFVTADVDKITVPALYADRAALPDDYMSQLNNAVNSGGYLLTHALLATIWLQENNYQMPKDFTTPLYPANAALIGDDTVVTDLEMEAAAFLYVTGQGALVVNTFVQRVIAAQNLDGGWSFSSAALDVSNWHPSVLGLMLLLHVEFPSDSYPPILAPASGNDSVGLNPAVFCSVAVWLFAFVNVKKRTLQFNFGLDRAATARLRSA